MAFAVVLVACLAMEPGLSKMRVVELGLLLGLLKIQVAELGLLLDLLKMMRVIRCVETLMASLLRLLLELGLLLRLVWLNVLEEEGNL